VLAVIVTMMKITGRSIESVNNYFDNNGEVYICGVNSYCDNTGKVYMRW